MVLALPAPSGIAVGLKGPNPKLRWGWLVLSLPKPYKRGTEQWQDNTLDIGPWNVETVEPPLLSDTTYHGKPSPYRMLSALARVASLNGASSMQ